MTTFNGELLGEAPKEPHLAWINDPAGLASAIPRGSYIYVVLDPSNPKKVQPLILAKVAKDHLIFRCNCDPRCHAVFRYQLRVTGQHPKR